MSPLLFEAIIFLKQTCNYWDLSLVYEAIKLSNLDRQGDESQTSDREEETIEK